MVKINKIIEINNFTIVCEFNTGAIKKLDILPLIQSQLHLNGISSLKNEIVFNKAAIGEMGEIFWKNIITTKSNEVWNYDISPEFAYSNGVSVN